MLAELRKDRSTADIKFNLEEIFKHDTNKTTCVAADEMAKGVEKMLHQQGVVAPVRYKSVGDHPFTGLFKGADYGIARLSESGIFVDGHNESNPSVALKF